MLQPRRGALTGGLPFGDRLASGDALVVATGATWRSTPSHVLGADLVAGEVHDLRPRVRGWAEPGADRSAWRQDGSGGSIEVTVPPGSEAELALPDGHAEPLTPGRHQRAWRAR